jgi:D-methionine transport system permease protein
MLELVLISFLETMMMVSLSLLIGLVFGIPLGSALFGISKKKSYAFFSFLINTFRSIPYIILVILILPLTRFCLNTSIGTMAATFPLSISAILLIARAMEDAMHTITQDVLDIGFEASMFQKIRHIIFPQCLPVFTKSLINITINLIGFSAMSGTVGGGGLGDLAFRYGYQRYDFGLVLIVVTIIIAIVHLVQFLGDKVYARISH